MGLVWSLEWRIAFARRRLFLLNVLVPLSLVTAIAFSNAPAVHAAAVYAILFAIHGTFGSAIPLVRDAEAGLVGRIAGAGIPARNILLERAGAGACLDAIQLAPSLGVAAWAAGASWTAVSAAVVALLGGLWVANLLGAVVATLARSIAEAALFAAVSALLLLHVSGVFRTGAPGSLSARLEALAPFRALHESLLGLSSAAPSYGLGAMVGWAILLPALLIFVSRPAIRLLSDVSNGR